MATRDLREGDRVVVRDNREITIIQKAPMWRDRAG